MDFGDLKAIVNEMVVIPLDHAFMLNNETSDELITKNNDLFDKLVLVDYQPTCEQER